MNKEVVAFAPKIFKLGCLFYVLASFDAPANGFVSAEVCSLLVATFASVFGGYVFPNKVPKLLGELAPNKEAAGLVSAAGFFCASSGFLSVWSEVAKFPIALLKMDVVWE